MTFVSMSVSAYVSHLVGAVVLGVAVGAGIVYVACKIADNKKISSVKQADIKQEEEEKQVLVLENSN